ncbi:MAG TPA: type II toxin-antitoxin system VapC family toxin [Candidatus Avalokitesvara rifleensis]|uniref:type II toxin-antitoxin system VapC family toxin n=1 Tax=Candidatus Avalokitesvara rifleensis TaxID=3367620 RepID=UPI0027126BDE|nr:type II toxin-antitoxin system VapC family toxin [Candidatus Brocadiales bacterium]
MAKRLKIYLDTSVPNAYFDERNSLRKEMTRSFWRRLDGYEVFISNLVLEEINDIGDKEKKKALLALISGFKVLSSTEEDVKALAEEYVTRGIFPVRYIEDAVHIAVASLNSLDVLISWNFEHIVKLKTKREVNAVNVLLGYDQLEIVEPSMM